ncbi:MAG: hypothetical protein U0176_20800 [Bacteroidia bacterium]
MADQSPLVVPIQLTAMVVNNATRQRTNFQRWKLRFENWASFESPEPDPFTGLDGSFGSLAGNNGIYLQWALPPVLLNGADTGPLTPARYRLVPNRWLVMRQSMNPTNVNAVQYAAWVVESDYVAADGTSNFLQTSGTSPQPTKIGRKVVLASSPYTGKPQGAQFLRAIGPGEVTFSSYQPYNENVFSLHDPLDSTVHEGDLLSYMVMGWYTDPNADPLTPGSTTWSGTSGFQDYIHSLGWDVALVDGQPSPDIAKSSVYEGLVYQIPWSTTANPLTANWPLGTNNVTVSIGNTAVDALTALAEVAATQQNQELDALLFEAFQYGLLDKLADPGGLEELERKIHAAWFQELRGGYRWALDQLAADDPSQIPPPPSPADAQAALNSLQSLNSLQAQYDAAIQTLASQQIALYEMYWKQGFSSQNGITTPPASYYSNQLRVGGHGILDTVIASLANVRALQAQLPTGPTPEALAQSVNAYLVQHNLQIPTGYQLRQYALAPYALTNDPTLLVSGLGTQGLLNSSGLLLCRFRNQLVYQVTIDGELIPMNFDGNPTGINLTGLPSVSSNIVNEFITLNPYYVSTSTNRSYQAMVPSIYTAHWQQPWNPLFIEWQVLYYPIDYQTNGQDNWAFDGKEFSWKGTGYSGKTIPYSGRIFLSPHSAYNFKWRLDQYLSQHPDSDLSNLEAAVDAVSGWDFLSQSIDGMGLEMLCRDSLMAALPTSTTVVSNGMTLGQYMGAVPKHPLLPGLPTDTAATSKFQPLRSGQMVLAQLNVIDRFGQTVSLVNSQNTHSLQIVRGESLIPSSTIGATETYRYIDLKPRLLQYARLDFELMNPNGTDLHWMAPTVNPIIGWLISNHVDQSLAVYDPEGHALGALKLLIDPSDSWSVHWVKAPVPDAPTFDQVNASFPTLGRVLSEIVGMDKSSFEAFLRVVDASLWGIQPTHDGMSEGMSVLSGRPLALVNANLQFSLGGLPRTDPSWFNTQNPAPNPVLQVPFRIHLGAAADYQDGLVGYYIGGNYETFNAVTIPRDLPLDGNTGTYVHLATPDQLKSTLGGTTQAVTLLLDPRGLVNATSGIVPVSQLRVPRNFVEPVLRNLQLYFRVGPLLTALETLEDGTSTIQLNPPALSPGTWSWVSGFTYEQSLAMGFSKTDQSARFPNAKLVLRNGMLVLDGAFDDDLPQ